MMTHTDVWGRGVYRVDDTPRRRVVRFLAIVLLLSATYGRTADGQDEARALGPSLLLSDPAVNSWAPALAADIAGNVHVVWSETLDPKTQEKGYEGETLFYRRWNGTQWSEPAKIVRSPEPLAAEWPAMAVDEEGILHLVWGTGGTDGRLFYSRAPACCANSAEAWDQPKLLADPIQPRPDITVDASGVLHVVYVSQPPDNTVFHRSSTDVGLTWSAPHPISRAPRGDVVNMWPRIAADLRQRLHVVWTLLPWPGRAVVYARSDDGGNTWSSPVHIDDKTMSTYAAGYGPVLINVATAGGEYVHVIWDGPPTVERTHRWSSDGGKSWSEPQSLIPEVTGSGRSGWNEMAIDSRGHLHAVSLSAPFHAAWDGRGWSTTERLTSDRYGEFVRAVISLGDLLHVVWLDKPPGGPFTVRYVRKALDAPEIAPRALSRTTLPMPQDWGRRAASVGVLSIPVLMIVGVLLMARDRFRLGRSGKAERATGPKGSQVHGRFPVS